MIHKTFSIINFIKIVEIFKGEISNMKELKGDKVFFEGGWNAFILYFRPRLPRGHPQSRVLGNQLVEDIP